MNNQNNEQIESDNEQENIETFANVINPVNGNTIDSNNIPPDFNYEITSNYIQPTTIDIKSKLINNLDNFFNWIINGATDRKNIPGVRNKKVTLYQDCGVLSGGNYSLPPNSPPYDLGIGKYLLGNLSPKIDKIGVILVPYGLQVTIFESCNLTSEQNVINVYENNYCYNKTKDTSGKVTFRVASLSVDIIDNTPKGVIDNNNINTFYLVCFNNTNGFLNSYFDNLYIDKINRIKKYNLAVMQKIDEFNNTVNIQICNSINELKYRENNLNIEKKKNIDNTALVASPSYRCTGGGGGHNFAGCATSANWLWTWERDNIGWYWRSAGWCQSVTYDSWHWHNGSARSAYRAACYDFTDTYKNAVSGQAAARAAIPGKQAELNNQVLLMNSYESKKRSYPAWIENPNKDSFKAEQIKIFLQEYADKYPLDGKKRATIIKKILDATDTKYNTASTLTDALIADWKNPNLPIKY